MTVQSAGQTLVGTGGNDTLSGGSANDTIWGDGLSVMVTEPFSLRIKASADLWQGAPRMRIWADKTLLGEVDVTAVHASGQWQDFTFTRAGLSSAAKIRIEYINDAAGGTATKDRNLWIDHIEVNGTPLTPDHSIYERGTKTQAGQSAMLWGGALVFNTADLPALKHPAWAPGGGNDSLSGGAGDDLIYGGRGANGIDGGAGTDTAAYLGNRADYTVVAETDGSIHVTGADGQDRLTSIEKFQFTDGTLTLKDLVPVITVTASGDAAGGIPPQFDLYVDGLKVGGTTSVTASHVLGQWQTFTFTPPSGTTAHSKIELRYTNDKATGGDRNLFVDYIEVNGTRLEAESAIYVRPGMTTITGTQAMNWAGNLIFNVVIEPPRPPGPVLKAPDLAEATKAGEIVSLQLENMTGKAQAAGEITFGHVFKPGDLDPGKYLVAVIDGREVPVQLDVKATNEDGSVRHALLTIAQPSLAAGATVNLMLKTVTHAPEGKAIKPADILAHGYDVDINLALKNADGTVTSFTVDAAAELARAAADGTLKTWMSGPLASEYRVVKAINDHLTATLDIRAFKDGSVRTDVIMGVESSYKPGMQSFYNYDIQVLDHGHISYAKTNIAHLRNATWHKEIWSGDQPKIHVVYDVDYLEKTGAVPLIDSSMGVLSSTVGLPSGANTDPMGNAMIYKKMSDVGGRSDIGIMPAWNARYLATQDATALKTMLANADASGSIPWHYRDEATGEYLRIDQHPKLWMDGRTNWPEFGSDGLANGFAKGTAAGWEMDTAHQPALNYLPYLVTGSQYYLDGLMAQSSYSIASYAPHYRGWGDGFIDFDQVRGRAWTWRNMSDSAFIAPDDSELKTYFNDMLESNLDALVKRYITNGAMDKYGQIEGFFRHDMWPDGDLLVWQSDFVALVLGSIAERGNSQAVELLKWMDNFTSGRFIHGDDGFDPRFGAAYILKVNSTGNGPVYTTWADFFKGSFGTSPKVPPDGILGTPDSPYGYAAIAKAAVASIFTAIQSPDAMEAFGFLAKSIVQAKGAQSFYYDPTWNIAPKLSDGSHLTFDDIRITKSSGDQTLTGSDKNELIHGSMGNDTIGGDKGIDILFGAEGDDTLNGGPGDDFLYGGTGNDRLSGSAGNDYLKGNAGNDTFVFGPDAGGRDTIGDFHRGTDLLEIKTDLTGLKTASQVLGTATADQDGNAVLHLGGVDIVLLGIHTSNLKADMIHLN